MAIPPAYQLALDMYEIDAEVMERRAETWRLLEPLLGTLIDRHFAKVIEYTPYYQELISKNRERLRGVIVEYTTRLFTAPLDEQFAADAQERVAAEIESGCDMRTRGAVAQSIITNFHRELLSRRGLSRRRALRATDTASRILMMDAATAVVLHHNATAKAARARGNDLWLAINDFGEAVKTIRTSMEAAVAALGDNAGDLAILASRASGEAGTAAKSAENAAGHVNTIAAAAEELSASISSVYGQATGSADAAIKATRRAPRTPSNPSPKPWRASDPWLA